MPEPGARGFAIRLATEEDLPALRRLIEASIGALQRDVLTAAEIEASRAVMGLDTSLVADGTYFVVEHAGPDGPALAGCGGWSRRATRYGGDHTVGRDAALLDPATDAARIRAMYTSPDFARRGVGRMILDHAEAAAAADGFRRVVLAATRAGEKLYLRCGYVAGERFTDGSGGVPVPLMQMSKPLPG